MEVDSNNGLVYGSTMKGHKGFVTQIAWSPDGELLAAGGMDTTVHVWRLGEERPFRILRNHDECVSCVAWWPHRRMLASGSSDLSIVIWDVESSESVRRLELEKTNGRVNAIKCIAWSPDDSRLFSGGTDGGLRCWNVDDGQQLGMRYTHQGWILCIAWSPKNDRFATGGGDGSICLWETSNKMKALGRFGATHIKSPGRYIDGLAWSPDALRLASALGDKSVRIWDMTREVPSEVIRLEGHTEGVRSVSFSADGSLLASKADDNSVRIWRTDKWEEITAARMTEANGHNVWVPSIAFHPKKPILATFGVNDAVSIWEIDADVLLSQTTANSVPYTTAKIVLLGDQGVGKTGLGWRLTHGEFKEHASTHGQAFWILPQLGTWRNDGTECEAILWDLAGQPDYRLIHALYLDDADLALLLFDPTNRTDPLHGVEYWLRQLRFEVPALAAGPSSIPLKSGTPTILVAARCDRGAPTLTRVDLDTFCHRCGLSGCINTSAKEGDGLEELIRQIKALVPWDKKPSTVTTTTFKRIKDHLLSWKENRRSQEIIIPLDELRDRLEQTDGSWHFTNAEMITAVGHLENYGYVRKLTTSHGETRLLLVPELLNNLAASFVLEARRNEKGLGALEERRLFASEYRFPELDGLMPEDQHILLDAIALLFIEHNICFRETDPLNEQKFLVFPELINLNKPAPEDGRSLEDGVAYTVSGAIQNVYASLVVLLGYTEKYTRTDQWRNHARYEVGNKMVCGFRQIERDGELEFVLYFGLEVGRPIRQLFQSLFESFLARRNLTVTRYEPVRCTRCMRLLERAVVQRQVRAARDFAFCPDCGERLSLPKMNEPIQLTREQQADVEVQRQVANMRTPFEKAIYRVQAYVKAKDSKPPECFISYAWGDPGQERWVEKNLASDLQKAGIAVVLDRWENAKIGSSIPRFVERVVKCDCVVIIGTPLYRQKYENGHPMRGFVVAAEGDLIGTRMIGTEEEKRSVLPALLVGSQETSLPTLLRGRVYADFRDERAYFTTAFNLILSMYGIQRNEFEEASPGEALELSFLPQPREPL